MNHIWPANKTDEYKPATSPNINAILNGKIPFEPNNIKQITGSKVVIVV